MAKSPRFSNDTTIIYVIGNKNIFFSSNSMLLNSDYKHIKWVFFGFLWDWQPALGEEFETLSASSAWAVV